ncbi:hypothetical protein ACFLQ2_03610 [archaeon]
MAAKEMVKEVKGLLAEGYSVDKVKANLLKIGFSDEETGEIIAEASGQIAAAVPAAPAAPVAPAIEEAPASLPPVEMPELSIEAASDEDLLLSAAGQVAELPEPAAPAAPVAPKPAEERRHHRHHHEKAGEPKPPAIMAAPGEVKEEHDAAPPSGAKKAVIIFVIAFIAILVMAYFLAFPKLGITLF